MSRTTPWLKLTAGCIASAMPSVVSVAVITAVPTVPERTVPVATPLAPVGEAGCVMVSTPPRSDESAMVFPATGWPFESRNVTVMVLTVTPSAGTNEGAATTVERVGLTPARTVTLRLFASAGSPSAFPAAASWAAAGVALSSTVEPKAAFPGDPGAPAVNVTRMFVRVTVTFVPSVIAIIWPLAVAQYSPDAGTGQFATAGAPPTETLVTARLA